MVRSKKSCLRSQRLSRVGSLKVREIWIDEGGIIQPPLPSPRRKPGSRGVRQTAGVWPLDSSPDLIRGSRWNDGSGVEAPSLSSQTKCNTCPGGVAMGSNTTSCRWKSGAIAALHRAGSLDPADRCSCGSRAIDDIARAEAQHRVRTELGRLSSRLRPAADRSAALVRRKAGARLQPCACACSGAPGPGLVARAGGWPARAATEGRTVIGCETIYRFIYAQLKRTNDGAWRRYLPRAKAKRGRRPQEGRQPGLADQGPCLRPPAPVGGARSTPSRPLGSRLHALRPLRPVSPGPARANLQAHSLVRRPRKRRANRLPPRQVIEPLPKPQALPDIRQRHRVRRASSPQRIKTFFCDPTCPLAERRRRKRCRSHDAGLPRQTNSPPRSQRRPQRRRRAYNHTPRRCLDFQTPAEVFSQLLHFKWESTSRLSPE